MITMTGWTMFRLLTAGSEEQRDAVGYARWSGWEIWNAYVRIKMNIAEPQGTEYKKQFKDVLLSLENQGFIEKHAPKTGRATPARSLWSPTSEGQAWWTREGLDTHFSDISEGRTVNDSDEYLGKWIHVTKKPVPNSVLADLQRRYKRGELAVRYVRVKK